MKKNQFYIPLALAILILFTGCNKSTRVMLVVGGHSFDTIEFFDMFHSMKGIHFDPVYQPEAMDILRSDRSESYDVLVFYDFVPDAPLKDSAIFKDLVGRGTPMLFLHHSICSFQYWDGYEQILGGKYQMPGYGSHESTLSDYQHGIDLQVEVVDRQHPVCWGVKDFQIHDEAYSNLTVLDGIHPLLRTDHPACSPEIAWINDLGESTCIYLIFGHDSLAYKNPSFRKLLNNSLKWLSEQG